MIPSTVNGKPVKNLGWLLAHWKQVQAFTIDPHPPTRGFADAVLRAHLDDGGEYRTGFADAGVLARWLDRPVFRGVPQTWNLPKP